MQPLTAKELQYMTDSMNNEDLLIKQCMAAAIHTQNQAVYNACVQMALRHQKHYQYLLGMLQQHVPIAPEQPSQQQMH